MKELFGRTSDGAEISLYSLKNVHGLEARITNYGGILVSLMVPDRNGELRRHCPRIRQSGGILERASVLRGDRSAGMQTGSRQGLSVSRGEPISSPGTTRENHLHGGQKGFDKVVWTAADRESEKRPGAESTICRVGTEKKAIPAH